MVHVWEPGFQLPVAATTLVFGPGLSAPDIPEGFRDQLRDFWADQPMPMVADASGLDWLTSGTFKRDAIRVITPHPGEAARLLGSAVADIESDRPAAVRQLSRRFGGCLVVLKGHQTLIGSAEGAQYLNSSGNPGLAQGGSGDLLAGLLGGLLAQPALAREPVRAVRHGVWWHGAAADRLAGSLPHWTIEDLPVALGSLDGDAN
jgi:NAD(P)H-hydrate epimerase